MTRETGTATWTLSAPEAGPGRDLLGLLLGVAFTLALFAGIASFQRRAPEAPPPQVNDLTFASLPVSPPPVPVRPTDAVAEVVPLAGFEIARSESAVHLAASPPDLAPLLPEELSKAPPATGQISLRRDLKPKLTVTDDAQHVYQRNELDLPVTVLERATPRIPRSVRDDASVLRVTLVAVIEPTGAVGRVRLLKSSGNPAFDDLMIEEIKAWIFSAPTKSGRKVRCLIEESITVRWEADSPFRT